MCQEAHKDKLHAGHRPKFGFGTRLASDRMGTLFRTQLGGEPNPTHVDSHSVSGIEMKNRLQARGPQPANSQRPVLYLVTARKNVRGRFRACGSRMNRTWPYSATFVEYGVQTVCWFGRISTACWMM